MRALRPAIRFDHYAQLVVDRPLSAVRVTLAAMRSRTALRTLAVLGGRSQVRTDGTRPRHELDDCLVVDQFHFDAGCPAEAGAALAPLQSEWQNWCSRSVGLIGEDRVAGVPRSGEPSVVIMLVVRRLAGSSRADMHNYWRHDHVPLASAKQSALRFIDYRQVEAFAEPAAAAALGPWTGDQIASHDGVAAISYPSRHAFLTAFLSPRAQHAHLGLILDELNFVDVPACELIIGIEHGFPA